MANIPGENDIKKIRGFEHWYGERLSFYVNLCYFSNLLRINFLLWRNKFYLTINQNYNQFIALNSEMEIWPPALGGP